MTTLESTTSWRKRPRVESVESLLALAHDRTRSGRETLASAVGDLFGAENGNLSRTELAIMNDILNRLVRDVETSVRQTLAQKLANIDSAPHELIVELANDDAAVALPVLKQSAVLQDHDLIEVIHHRTLEHRLAISLRPDISENVSDALVQTDQTEVIESLLGNSGCKLSSTSMSYLVDKSEKVESIREPLLKREELSEALARKMYWWVSAALRQNILDRYALDPDEFDDAMQHAVQDALHRTGHGEAPGEESLQDLLQIDEVSQHRMVQVLRAGEVAKFQKMMCDTIGLPLPEFRRIMFEPGGENLAIACRAADFALKVFAAIYRLIRTANDGDDGIPRGELMRLSSLYLDIDPDHARAVLREWRRHPDYVEAIRQVSGDVSSRA